MKIDLIFLIILGIVTAYIFVLYRINEVESMSNDVSISSIDRVKEAVKQVYVADVDAIRNLSNVATQLQKDGLTIPGNLTNKGVLTVDSGDLYTPIIAKSNIDSHILLKTKNDDNKNIYLVNRDGNFKLNSHGVGDMFGVNKDGHHYIRHTGDSIMNIEGDGNNPYISLGKTGTWDKKKLYIQNVDSHTENPLFRVGIHGTGAMMDMNKSHGVRWLRKDGRWTHFDWEDGKNYLRGETIQDGNLNINKGALCINGKCINEKHLSMLVDGFKLQTGAGGWYPGSWFHTHRDGVMRHADPIYRTVYKPHHIDT